MQQLTKNYSEDMLDSSASSLLSRANTSNAELNQSRGLEFILSSNRPRILLLSDNTDGVWLEVNQFLEETLQSSLILAKSLKCLHDQGYTAEDIDIIVMPSSFETDLCKDIPDTNWKDPWCIIVSEANIPWLLPSLPFKVIGNIYLDKTDSVDVLRHLLKMVFKRWLVKLDAALISSPNNSEQSFNRLELHKEKVSDSNVIEYPETENSDQFREGLVAIKSLYDLRKTLFDRAGSEPWFSLILNIAFAASTNREVDVTSLSAETNTTMSTLSRRLDYMEDAGWIMREISENDRRRTYIKLTEKMKERIIIYVTRIKGIPI